MRECISGSNNDSPFEKAKSSEDHIIEPDDVSIQVDEENHLSDCS